MATSRHFSLERITLAVFLAASINLGWQFYRMYREGLASERAYQQYGVIVCKFGPARDESSRMYIEVLLLLAFVGSRLRGLKETVLTAVGLSGALLFYLFWWQYYFALASLAPSEIPFIRQTWYLYRASYLDIAIMGGIVLLILLHIHSAILSLFRTTDAWSGLAGK